MYERAAPADGDIVVRTQVRQGRLVYVLSRAPGPGQYFVQTLELAIAHARRFGALGQAPAWFVSADVGIMMLPLRANRGARLSEDQQTDSVVARA